MTNTRSVLVTGASTGIGRAIATDLATVGMQVFGTVRRKEDAKALTSATPEGAEPIIALMMDVQDTTSVRAAAAKVEEHLGEGGLWGLVNNAGISVASPLEYVSEEAFQLQMDVNLTGVLRCVQAFMPLLKRCSGRIVNISSMSGRVAFPMVGAYCTSKHALEGLSDALRLELGVHGMEVSIIQPGSIATPIWDRSRARAADLMKRLPEHGIAEYRQMIDQALETTESNGEDGADPQLVADVVRHALTAARPRTRYQVGKDAKILLFLRRWLLSDRRLDKLIRRNLGLN
ncbi:MAG: SDR family oxidoreductase [Planctomycetes bacterium]|nr:SDR family oxidoreductase [Planctomycetota bacterium]MCP4771957.1 SDR family oxidoreductase [Planctomycetota bacterium]MCP4860392.1 SDR family oxidoreductase [Planctomycetota bacterium]